MLINWSGIGITEGRGKLQGTVMLKGRSGPSARVNVKGVNPRTNSQITRRSLLAAFAQAWRGLTATQQATWNASAASGQFAQKSVLGRSYNPTGAQLYSKLNLNIALMGGSAITEPPTKPTLPQILVTDWAIADGLATADLTFSGTLGANDRLLVYTTPNLSPGVFRPSNSLYRFIISSAAVSPIEIYPEIEVITGQPVIGQKIFVKCLVGNILSGTVAQAGSASAVVTA